MRDNLRVTNSQGISDTAGIPPVAAERDGLADPDQGRAR